MKVFMHVMHSTRDDVAAGKPVVKISVKNIMVECLGAVG